MNMRRVCSCFLFYPNTLKVMFNHISTYVCINNKSICLSRAAKDKGIPPKSVRFGALMSCLKEASWKVCK